MTAYSIRPAVIEDIPFLVDVVIQAEKGNSNKLGLSTLFNLPESKVKELLIQIFEEEIDGCEFSISSYLIVEANETPVAGFGAWIEGATDGIPSSRLKSNLLGYYFGKDAIEYLNTKVDLIKDIVIERTPGSLQFEYLYVNPMHRGYGLGKQLIINHEKNALSQVPDLKLAQVQVFENNHVPLRLYESCGFDLSKKYESTINEAQDVLPHHVKCLMEKSY